MSDKRDEGASAESQTALERPPTRTQEEGPESLPEGTVLAGRYEVRKLIGRGGMGVVVEAFDAAVGVSVAIKVVRAEYAGERQWTERLAREVKLARRIQHPNVCRVFDFAQSDGRALLIMEQASGGALRSQLLAGGARARPLGERLADARAIAAGVAAIHAAGIVHRDLSPQNVLRMADGRLVVSDFGLATDAPDGTTSIHGGTVAYMAPEVLRGGRASFAADIWSLGAVIHEVVFGERMRWEPKTAEMRSAVESETLTRVERGVLEICRACTTRDPARRPRDAGQIARRLEEAALARAARRRWGRRALVVVAVALVVAGGTVEARRIQAARRRAAVAPTASAAVDPLMIVPTGEPDDWTDKAKVLAEVPDKIRCIVALPDRRTLRFVWGHPARAEDVDTHTGERKASPLVQDAYAEGCPDLSPDGKRLVYAGHTKDDRAFAFVSARSDGRDAVPEAQTAEPTLNSDPVWLADGESFVYDIDETHVALFSMATRKSVVTPTGTAPVYTAFHEALGSQIFVNAVQQGTYSTEVTGFQYPGLGEVVRWKEPGMVRSLASRDGKTYYHTYRGGSAADLVEVDPLKKRARIMGAIRGQSIGQTVFLEDGLAFYSGDWTSTLVLRSANAGPRRIPMGQDIVMASSCGSKIIAVRSRGNATFDVVWLDEQGKTVGSVREYGRGTAPICNSDGTVIFSGTFGEHPGVQRCDRNGCRTILLRSVGVVAISPDDKRLAFMEVDSAGLTIRWIRADGTGPIHEIADSENMCPPIWASDKVLWVSLRKGRQQVWTEIDTDTGRPTGRTSPGSNNCADGLPDPERPLHAPVEIDATFRSQLRLLPSKYLPAG